MPSCLKCGTALAVNEEGVAPVLCDRCAGVATGRARRSMALGGLGGYPVTAALSPSTSWLSASTGSGLHVTDLGVEYRSADHQWRILEAVYRRVSSRRHLSYCRQYVVSLEPWPAFRAIIWKMADLRHLYGYRRRRCAFKHRQ